MDPIAQFEDERRRQIAANGENPKLKVSAHDWIVASMEARYVYNFAWLGRPIIQFPQDIQAVQEIIWSTRPDVVIETGIAHGGSLILSASILAMLDYADALAEGAMLDPANPKRKVIGVDIDIRAHNRAAIEGHPMAPRIAMVQGSSVDPATVDQVKALIPKGSRVMVCLDSMHTHDHVLAELNAYAPLVSPGCYCIVFDSFVEDVPKDLFPDRPWGPGDNPKTAVHAFIGSHPEFEIDRAMHSKLMISSAPDGYLKRLR